MNECKHLLAPLQPGAGERTHYCEHGRAVQVEPLKPKLIVPGSKCSNLRYDKLLSTLAFKFNSRRFSTVRSNDYGNLGRTVQVDPCKAKLKPPGTKRLKLNCDILLSTSGFKFNLRRYTWGSCRTLGKAVQVDPMRPAFKAKVDPMRPALKAKADRMRPALNAQDDPMRPALKYNFDPMRSALKAKVDPMSPGTIKRLKLKYDALLSSFGFNFNWRRFTPAVLRDVDPRQAWPGRAVQVHNIKTHVETTCGFSA